jgi:serine/threonine-protein kinase
MAGMGLPQLKILRHIARGGLADISLAVNSKGEYVVLRQLHKHLVWKVRPNWYFRRGMRIRRRLCPNGHIVCPADKGHCGLRPHELLEYVPGENLREMILHKAEAVNHSTLEILRQAAVGLSHVHKQGFLHLDVKAENVLVDCSDAEAGLRVKLTDFDMSRSISLSKKRLRCGTASHMAPEQLSKGSVSFANDIFAFGVMAYFMVTGRMPFHGWSEKEARKKQASSTFQVTDPRKINADLTPRLGRIIQSCLEKDVGKRFPSMAYLVQELGRL